MDLINNNYDECKQSSIRTLAKEHPEEDLIRGKHCFGDFMESEGFKAVPSSIRPKPGKIINYNYTHYIRKPQFAGKICKEVRPSISNL